MTATLAPSFAPPNSLRMWCDAQYIYVELPVREGLPPCILSYRKSELGLSRALSLLGQHSDYSGTPLPPIPKMTKGAGTPKQQDVAENILRRMGMIR